jgi:hypothetical protein
MRDQRVGFIWVVEIRKADTGVAVQRRSFGTHKAARRWKYHLDEMPDPTLDGCIIEARVDVIPYPSYE